MALLTSNSKIKYNVHHLRELHTSLMVCLVLWNRSTRFKVVGQQNIRVFFSNFFLVFLFSIFFLSVQNTISIYFLKC